MTGLYTGVCVFLGRVSVSASADVCKNVCVVDATNKARCVVKQMRESFD